MKEIDYGWSLILLDHKLYSNILNNKITLYQALQAWDEKYGSLEGTVSEILSHENRTLKDVMHLLKYELSHNNEINFDDYKYLIDINDPIYYEYVVGSQGGRVLFDITTTDMPFYDDMMRDPEYYARAKGLKYTIKYMSPDDYFQQCAKIFNSTVEYAHRGVTEQHMERLIEWINEGNVFPMPMLNFAKDREGQEGRHRALIAQRFGYDLIPVMVVEDV